MFFYERNQPATDTTTGLKGSNIVLVVFSKTWCWEYDHFKTDVYVGDGQNRKLFLVGMLLSWSTCCKKLTKSDNSKLLIMTLLGFSWVLSMLFQINH